jgi:vacuolar protein-sorting-associated protein 4
MSSIILAKAYPIIGTAVNKDTENKKDEACKLYMEGADLLIQALKVETETEMKLSLRRKIDEILTRCEKLQAQLPPKITPKVVDLTTSYDDIIGLDNVKRVLKECTSLVDLHPDLFKDASPAKRILLFGPPGTGKTMLAKAMACECKRQFFSVSSSDVMSKWQGESEQNVRKIFESASAVPSVLFIDEVDALFSVRSDFETDSGRRVKNEFLTRIQGFETDSKNAPIILAATNVPWNIDPAFRRRFEKSIYIPLPVYQDRIHMFKKNLHTVPEDLLDWDMISQKTEGYSASDIQNICRDMMLSPVTELQQANYFIQKDDLYYPCSAPTENAVKITVMEIPTGCIFVRSVEMQDFLNVIEITPPSINISDLDKYAEWEKMSKKA